jgi:signal transduction histidine kinase
VVILDPQGQARETQPPAVLLEEVVVGGNLRIPRMGRAPESEEDATLERVTISPGQRDIEFNYTGLSFAAPEKLRFRYQLEGVDSGWVEAQGRRVAYYQRIPPGEYIFRVMAGNADNVWSEQAAGMAVTVQPFFWERGWFVASLAAVALLAAAGTVWLVERRRYRQRLSKLELQNAVARERLRISQDMHDHIGSILTRVSILSDVGQGETEDASSPHQQFHRIGTQVRSAVQALDEIVWATNPRNDNLRSFADYVGRFADEFFESSPVRCWQEIPTDLPDRPLRADLRHDLFLAIREAFNNILKHSGATAMWLKLELTDTSVILKVEDNGHGFSPESVPAGGNGLTNIRSRLADCGGRMELESRPGQGTKICFTLPVGA